MGAFRSKIPTPQPSARSLRGRARPCRGPRGIPRPWQLAGLGAPVLGLVAALLFSGAAAAREVSDPGALVRWGLPVSKAIHNVALATVIGGLIFAVGILPRDGCNVARRSKDQDAPEHPAFTRALAMAAAAGAVWTLSAIAVLVLGYADIAGQGISGDPEFTRVPRVLHDGHRNRPGVAGRRHHRRRGHHRPASVCAPAAAWR